MILQYQVVIMLVLKIKAMLIYTLQIKKFLNLEKSKYKAHKGKIVPVYDIERCLCDILKDKESQDIEIIKYAYKTYVKSPKKNIHKLIEYAKKLKVEKEVNSNLEVLLW